MPRAIRELWQQHASKQWTPVAEDAEPHQLPTHNQIREFLRDWIQDSHGKGKIIKIVAGPNGTFCAHGQCTRELQCQQKWKWSQTADVVTWFVQGDHAPASDRVAQMGHADRLAHLPPLQARAQLMSEHLDAPQAPSLADLDRARRRLLRRKTPATTPDVADAWVQVLQRHIAGNPDRKPHEMLYYNLICQADWLPLELDTKATQGSCLFLSKNMLGIAQKVLEEGHRAQHKITLLLDATYKLCINDWALVIAGAANKHIGQKEHLPCTECVPLAYAWVPKENFDCLGAFLVTLCEIYAQHNVPLRTKLAAVMVDGHKGGESAIRQARKLTLRQLLPTNRLFCCCFCFHSISCLQSFWW